MLISVAYPDDTPGDPVDNPTKIYHYEDPNDGKLFTGITDENGDRYTTYTYDNRGRAIVSERAGGADRSEFTYNTGSTVTVKNSLGKESIFTFEVFNGLSRVTQVDGQPTALCGAMTSSLDYDANGYVASRTDNNGNITNYTYTADGLVASMTEAVGDPEERTTTTTWDPVHRVPLQITHPGQTETFTYDSEGRQLTRTLTDTQTQTVPYATTGNTRTWTYTYTT